VSKQKAAVAADPQRAEYVQQLEKRLLNQHRQVQRLKAEVRLTSVESRRRTVDEPVDNQVKQLM
jgi:multidrug resistance efflux pump